jgi:radical SAM protein with 4Fe4S-binding SPASM domain
MSGCKRCSWLHDSVSINPRGDVYACCHQKPGVFGNIYENTLEEIFNSDRVKQFRQQEIDGTLPCMKTCTLVQKDNVKDDVIGNYHADLRYLLIEFGDRCNIRCIMCVQDHASTLELDPETIVKNIEIPKSCDKISLYGGEPTILKSAKKFFDHCAQSGSKVAFLTNGLAISEDMALKIARHCSDIFFSLNAASKEIHEIVNAGSKFEKVLRNVKRVVQAKKEVQGDVLIGGQMTIVEQNVHEIPQFIAKREEFEFEVVKFSYDWRVPRLLAKDPALKSRLTAEIGAAIEQAMSGKDPRERRRIHTERLTMLGLV